MTDIICFGALSPCSVCNGKFIFRNSFYYCTGHDTEWTKCFNITAYPERVPIKLTDALLAVLETTDFQVKTRILRDEIEYNDDYLEYV